MKFLWLHDPLLKVLFENDEILAVDKPYGIDSHTNDAKAGQADFIQPGLIEIYEKQLNCALHIIHRLDKTTTGVIVFGKSLEAAKKYQTYFRNRETKKKYVFVTASRSAHADRSTEKPILRNGVELEAKTSFTRLKVAGGFELWQATPFTGRNHQIRIHGAEVGLPLLGDAKYGGAKFPFLCLHNARIEFPNGVAVESSVPGYFEDLSVLSEPRLARALHEIDRRRRLFAFGENGDVGSKTRAPGCLRLIHSERGDGSTGFSLDQFGERLVAAGEAVDTVVVEKISATLGKKIDTISPTSAGAASSDPQTWTASEGSQKHEMRVGAGQAPGVYLDQRLPREWLRQNSESKSVLVLYSFTGGSSVAAAVGGAREVVSVDTNKNMLNWSRRNFEINGLQTDTHKFFLRDALVYLDQCLSKAVKYDLIVCDPPAFSRGEKGIFKVETGLDVLLEKSFGCLAPGGILLFSTASDDLRVDDIRVRAEAVAKTMKLKNLEVMSVQPSLDFELPGEKQTLKSFLFHI